MADEVVGGRIRDLHRDEITGICRAIIDIDDAVDLRRQRRKQQVPVLLQARRCCKAGPAAGAGAGPGTGDRELMHTSLET